jgi:hypothetical protein
MYGTIHLFLVRSIQNLHSTSPVLFCLNNSQREISEDQSGPALSLKTGPGGPVLFNKEEEERILGEHIAFWDIAPCSLVEADQRFRGDDGDNTHLLGYGQTGSGQCIC